MQKPQTRLHDLDSILSDLTRRIQADVDNWYGGSATLILPPTFHPREWSYFIRYEVQISETDRKVILVKIRHAENMPIQEAIVSKKMNEEMWNEFSSLVDIQRVFTQSDRNSLFFTIRPLTCYEELNAVVQEEAQIRTLKSLFQSPKMWLGGCVQSAFDNHMQNTGRWLRIFHDELGKTNDGVLFDDQFYEEIQENLSIIKSNFGHADIDFTKELMTKLYSKYKNITVKYKSLHNDFNSSNVFITPDGRICSFDAKNEQGSLYIDLAKLILDLEVSRIQIISGGKAIPYSGLQKFTNSLLKGYFVEESVNFMVLRLFQLRFLIEKWKDSEMKLKSLSGIKKMIFAFGMVQLRSYFLKLLQRYVYDYAF